MVVAPEILKTVPQEIAGWRNMTDEEFLTAFSRTSALFQEAVYRFLNRTETCVSYLLHLIEHRKFDLIVT